MANSYLGLSLFIYFWTCSSSTVSQSFFWVCLWTFVFRCNQVSVEFWFYFGTWFFSEFGCVGPDTFPRIPPPRALAAAGLPLRGPHPHGLESRWRYPRFWVFWVWFWTYVFRCNQVSVGFWFYFGTWFFQSLVVLDLTHSLGYLHRELSRPRGCPFGGPTPAGSSRGGYILGFEFLGVILDFYFYRAIIVSFGDFFVFHCKPVGVVRCYGTCNFSKYLVPGTCIFYSEFGCVPHNIYWYLLYVFPLHFIATHLFNTYPLSTCPCILQFTGCCLECSLNTGPLNPESVALTTEPWSCEII